MRRFWLLLLSKLFQLAFAVNSNWIAGISSNLGVLAEDVFPSQSTLCEIQQRDDAELEIQDFLSTATSVQKFYVQGWRWHTLSLIRDSHRLNKYAKKINKTSTKESLESLNTAVKHIVDFNLKGLQRIEDETFFPWLRKKLISDDVPVKDAFKRVIDGVDRDRKKVGDLASLLRSEIRSLEDTTNDAAIIDRATIEISRISQEISLVTKSIMDREDRLLVPAIAKIVPSSEQKTFNNKVLRNLGIFESRCHLVAMHDAVHDKLYGDAKERALFNEQIPSVARMMIGRWKKTLYDPKVGVLE